VLSEIHPSKQTGLPIVKSAALALSETIAIVMMIVIIVMIVLMLILTLVRNAETVFLILKMITTMARMMKFFVGVVIIKKSLPVMTSIDFFKNK
jgi:hypothetical protein